MLLRARDEQGAISVQASADDRVDGAVPVPPEWQARGFSGAFGARVMMSGPVAAALAPRTPCLWPRDQAWLLLDVAVIEGDGEDEPGGGVMTVVRLDAAALVDKIATDRGVMPRSGGCW